MLLCTLKTEYMKKDFFKYILLIFLILYVPFLGWSQSDTIQKKTKKMTSSSAVNSASEQIENTMKRGGSNSEIAESYYLLALELIKSESWVKAEFYLKKAIQLIENEKDNPKLAIYYRELAKVQEKMNKNEDAISNFQNAASNSIDKNTKTYNLNDQQRVQNSANPSTQLEYLTQNNKILMETGKDFEIAENFEQIGNVNLKLNQPQVALDNYEEALKYVKQKPEKEIPILQQMTQIYTETKEFDKAILLQKELIKKADSIGNFEMQVIQLRELGIIYIKSGEKGKGISIIKQAYQKALDFHLVREAKNTLLLLTQFESNQTTLKLMYQFMKQLDTLIANDNTLVDSRLFEISEEKIAQLEKEKILSQQLLSRKNRYNYLLGGLVVIITLVTLIILWFYRSVKRKNYKIALQSLRREMNPHFIFNSLNSVNQYIANNNEMEANRYLTSYSQLMRKSMENSNLDFVSVADELEMITRYLELEKLRFPDIFEYKISISDNIDQDTEMIPNMLIQPHLENAIWHGLRYKTDPGFLLLSIQKTDQKMVITVEDNGIGIQKSRALKTENQKKHESRGLKNVKERIFLLNKLYHKSIRCVVDDKQPPESGVIVKIEC
ncbi:MAG: regulator of cell autolysis [Bacteroidetes bacterium]|nr:regulator of cell autolysis [Bacteroidota bacterium]